MPLDITLIRRQRPQNTFHYFPSVGSTMTEAARLVAQAATHGTVVLADEQTAGVGRLGRSWISQAEAGVYASVILRLPLAPAELPIASLVIGLAAAEGIQKASQLACDLRWPNDVLIGEQKTAGILPQLVHDCVIAGIGINVNNTQFPNGLRTPATSLYLASGKRLHSREQVVVAVLESLETFTHLLQSGGREAILRAFSAASSYVRDRRIVVEENNMRGVTCGLDEYGFLLVRNEFGTVVRVSSGGVRPDSGVAS